MIKNELITALLLLKFQPWYRGEAYLLQNKHINKGIYVEIRRVGKNKKIKGFVGTINTQTAVVIIEKEYNTYTKMLREITSHMKDVMDDQERANNRSLYARL